MTIRRLLCSGLLLAAAAIAVTPTQGQQTQRFLYAALPGSAAATT